MSSPRHEYTKRLVASIPEKTGRADSQKEILKISHLDVFYREGGGFFKKASRKKALSDVSLSVERGKSWESWGRAAAESPPCPRLLQGLTRVSRNRWTRRGSAPRWCFRILSDPLNPAKKIGWILEEPLRVRGVSGQGLRESGWQRKCWSKSVWTESFYSRRPRELSGGQRQRISIGTALLADSQAAGGRRAGFRSGRDGAVSDFKASSGYARGEKNTLLFVSHDLNVVRCVCHRVAVLYLGEVVESGAVGGNYHNPCHPSARGFCWPPPWGKTVRKKRLKETILVNWSLTLEKTRAGERRLSLLPQMSKAQRTLRPVKTGNDEPGKRPQGQVLRLSGSIVRGQTERRSYMNVKGKVVIVTASTREMAGPAFRPL